MGNTELVLISNTELKLLEINLTKVTLPEGARFGLS